MEEEKMDWIKGINFSKNMGEISLSGQRHVLINANSFKAYRDAISEIIGHGADAVLYLAGKRHTEKFIRNVIEKSPFARLVSKSGWGRNKIAEKVVLILDDYGYGKTGIEKMDLNKESIVTLRNSCIATNYTKKQKRPVCSYISGLLAGGTQAITGKACEVVETHCIAKGDKHCRFSIKVEKTKRKR